jgi:prepilin-type N-terminal cleavage/methylation domain-containing protein
MHRRKTKQGFTLVEVMIGAALGGVIMAAVLSTYTYMARNLARLASYQTLEAESRKALSYLSRDLSLAQGVKTGTTPTTSAVTLTLPSGDVSYTYNSSSHTLTRQATFGVSPSLTFLHNDSCQCTTFTFRYYTSSDGAPTNQLTPSAYVPYSIKQIQVSYTVESPSGWSVLTRTRYEGASARYVFRNRGAPDGT